MNMVTNGKFIHLQANLVVNCDLHFLLIIIEVRFKAQRSCTNIRKDSVSLLIILLTPKMAIVNMELPDINNLCHLNNLNTNRRIFYSKR